MLNWIEVSWLTWSPGHRGTFRLFAFGPMLSMFQDKKHPSTNELQKCPSVKNLSASAGKHSPDRRP